jgi:hypothetical protein
MAWAEATAYSEAVQNPRVAFREAQVGHGDLQHGNLMLVPIPGSRVQLVPAEALLTASGMGVTIEGEGSEPTVTVASPDGKTRLVLLAVLEGYEHQQIELQPIAGETGSATITLSRLPGPEVPAIPSPPPETLTLVSGTVGDDYELDWDASAAYSYGRVSDGLGGFGSGSVGRREAAASRAYHRTFLPCDLRGETGWLVSFPWFVPTLPDA